MGRVQKLANWYGHRSPRFRFGARQVGVAVISYIVWSVKSGETFTLSALALGTACAAGNALFGVLGLEPFVGINKPDRVEVPVPQSVEETT